MVQADRKDAMTVEESALTSLVARIVDILGSSPKISPAWIATAAMKELDPDRHSVDLVYGGCHLHLRQLAREQLRKRFETRDEELSSDQHEMFPDLQKRYPSARSKDNPEPEYVLLEHMSRIDVDYNVRRLTREGQAKLKHAAALRAWDATRRGRGTA
jgi:hypothetical protein